MAVASDGGLVERRFMRDAMRAPLLAVDREQALARRWRNDADDAALQELTGAYMRLVIAMASKFAATDCRWPIWSRKAPWA